MIVVFIDDNPLLVGWVGSEIGSTIERYDPIENNWQVFGTHASREVWVRNCRLSGKFDELMNFNIPCTKIICTFH